MKKIVLTLMSMILLSSFAFAFFKKTPETELVVMPMFSTETQDQNKVWAGTFQLAWNDLMDNVVKSPIEFTDGPSKLAEELNQQEFVKEMLSDSAYYAAHGFANKNLKKQIETALIEKFNETSDLLENIDWSGRNYLVYAMLKKDFEFLNSFDELKKDKFGKLNNKKVQYFGINEKSQEELRENVTVLFYNNPKDFAVELSTKQNDKVLLYRTDDNKSLETLYNDMIRKSQEHTESRRFGEKDKLKIPFISFKSLNQYPEIQGKTIKNADLTIDQAIQSIDFKMDNKGIKLKSEAALIMKMSMPVPVARKPAEFYFDDTFVMFLIEKDKPYFALRVTNIAALNKKNN